MNSGLIGQPVPDEVRVADRFAGAGFTMRCATEPAWPDSFLTDLVVGFGTPDVHILACRSERFTMHEANLLCLHAPGGRVMAMSHIWNHDSYVRALHDENLRAGGPCSLRGDRLRP